MKKLIYIFIVQIVVSCNNMKDNAPSVNADYEVLKTEKIIAKPNFIYEELAIQKLQEMYDLISLKEQHPEFSKAIKSQLKAYTNDSIGIPNSKDILIKNIKLKGEVVKVSDSVQKMKLFYDIISNSSIKQDSIWAIIMTNKIDFEGKKIESKKIKFNSI